MIEYKQSQLARVPVRIFDNSGIPVAGVLIGAVTLTIIKSTGAVSSVSPASWTEITTGAYLNEGVYSMEISGSDTNVAGQFLYAVSNTGNKTYHGAVKIVANEEVDTFARVGAPVGASISADVAVINTKVGVPLTTVSGDIAASAAIISTISTRVYRSQLLREGRSKIFTSGGDINRQVDYAADGLTVIQKWDLKDSAGAATTVDIFERVPVLAIP